MVIAQRLMFSSKLVIEMFDLFLYTTTRVLNNDKIVCAIRVQLYCVTIGICSYIGSIINVMYELNMTKHYLSVF